MEEYLKRLDIIKDKILMKVEMRLESDEKVSADLLCKLADITKDMAATQKYIVEAWSHKKDYKEDSEL